MQGLIKNHNLVLLRHPRADSWGAVFVDNGGINYAGQVEDTLENDFGFTIIGKPQIFHENWAVAAYDRQVLFVDVFYGIPVINGEANSGGQ